MKNEALNRFREASQDQQVCEDLAYSLAEFILYQQKEQQMSGLLSDTPSQSGTLAVAKAKSTTKEPISI